MGKKNLNEIITRIQIEITNLSEALEIIEVSQNSVKRDRFCKKRNMSYTQFMKAFLRAKNEIFMYPLLYHTQQAIINMRKSTQKEYKILHDNTVKVLKTMIDKGKEKKLKSVDNMEKLLSDLKDKKVEKKEKV